MHLRGEQGPCVNSKYIFVSEKPRGQHELTAQLSNKISLLASTAAGASGPSVNMKGAHVAHACHLYKQWLRQCCGKLRAARQFYAATEDLFCKLRASEVRLALKTRTSAQHTAVCSVPCALLLLYTQLAEGDFCGLWI